MEEKFVKLHHGGEVRWMRVSSLTCLEKFRNTDRCSAFADGIAVVFDETLDQVLDKCGVPSIVRNLP